ncbi:hypothetical protein JT07_s3gp1 [Cladosporium cladosporioides virus 1]|uniref:Methyltransferase domain-containing protein n=1 Tax=Cladosporium cladosporioides virus 1 TaxID=1529605 RepID=A0A076JS36_9VIRU|nr:hypothetical protein JT07_s3gp1 [Cladosporium cladosporioides virus 1]AII80569.1 hypothetical protein [Cladosporium cladosporioides virus 1]
MRRTGFSRDSLSRQSYAPSVQNMSRRPETRRRASVLSTTSLATSSNRSVSVTAQRGPQVQPKAPLELYEYGDPVAQFSNEFRHNPQGVSDAVHLRYLTQEQLNSVRADERRAGRALVDMSSALVPVNGARVLILACGRGATIAAIARYGPASMTLVDSNPDVVAGALEQVERIGQSASVNVFPVVDDAWSFARSDDGAYDLILCVHSVAQIIKSSPSGSEGFANDVSQLLAPGGILIMDEHMSFTDVDGVAPAGVSDRADRHIATGLGKFNDDVPYMLPRVLPGCARRAEWVTPGNPHPMQRWFYIAWEKRSDRENVRPPAPTTFPRLAPLPACGPVSDPVLFELSYPRASRGTKLPISRDDRRVVQPGRLMPKVDGTAAVLLLDGSLALHSGPKMGGAFRLPCHFDVPTLCTAELVLSSSGDYLLFVTGVIDRGGRPVDPSSNAELRTLDGLHDYLSEVGIIVNSPDLIPHVSGNTLVIPGSPAGRTVPVDGVNLLANGRWGRFFKPSSTLSIDVAADDWAIIKGDLVETFRLTRPFGNQGSPDFPRLGPANSGGVVEVGVEFDGLMPHLRPLRGRPDKRSSDKTGKVLAFLSALVRIAPIAVEVSTTSRLINFLNTG